MANSIDISAKLKKEPIKIRLAEDKEYEVDNSAETFVIVQDKLKDKEFNNIRNSIIDELKNKCKKPNTDSFIELAKYNNFIYNKADELVIWTICPKIIKIYRE